MTEIPTESDGEVSPGSIAFWLGEARLMKETAELSWNSEINLLQRAKLIYSPQHNRVVRHTIEELGTELNLLYRYLISLAIQYLAIGLLVDRNPQHFLVEQPGHHIVALLQDIDIKLSPQQLELLTEIENAYEWGDRYPFGKLGDGHDELRPLTHQLSQMDVLTLEEKGVLDALYEKLIRLAEGRLKGQ